jgi:hypothetical protein
MTATMTRPDPLTVDREARRAAREAALLASFDPTVPGIEGDGAGIVLHVDAERDLTFTWYNISRRSQDFQSRERGFLVSRLSVTRGGINGTEVAYLNVTHTTKELVAAEFPTPFHWAEENTSALFGFKWAAEKGETVSDAEIWATAYNHLKTTPPSAKNLRVWTFSASHAPTDPKVLKAELKTAERIFAEQMRGFVRWLQSPFVDFSRVNHDMVDENGVHFTHGAGIGRLMYVLAAQQLATMGKTLRASGCQTEYAQRLWQRLAADETLPVRKKRVTYYVETSERTKSYLCLDYTKTI